MARRFTELDAQQTRLGLLTLRRRIDPQLDRELYEVKLDEEFLMSSLFTVAERELATLGLAAVDPAALPEGSDRLDVLVGGLGLGYTALAALADPRVGSLTVVDALDAVIGWHRAGLLPEAAAVTADPRTRLVHGDFFAMMRGDVPVADDAPPRFHAVLLDVDHSPRHLLHDSHADLYTEAGLRAMTGHLHPGGVFALWSDDPPDTDFLATLDAVLDAVRAEVVTFPNPLTRGESRNTVYVAVRR